MRGVVTQKVRIQLGHLLNCWTQIRWRTKLEAHVYRKVQLDRVRENYFECLASDLRHLEMFLKLHSIMHKFKSRRYCTVERMSQWRNIIGLDIRIGKYINGHPHVFDVFTHPVSRNICCRTTAAMMTLLSQEKMLFNRMLVQAKERVRRLLMMSNKGRLKIATLDLVRRELGLPADFRVSVLERGWSVFRIVDSDVVELVRRSRRNGSGDVLCAEVEKWREREYHEKWLVVHEVRFAFPIKIAASYIEEEGFWKKMWKWQCLSYQKPYQWGGGSTCHDMERNEKRVVAVVHEILSLTVERVMPLESLSNFQEEFSMVVNLRELLLKHPGIFYLSIRGWKVRVFLKEAYSQGRLFKCYANPIYEVRRRMMELISLKTRNSLCLPVFDPTCLIKDKPPLK